MSWEEYNEEKPCPCGTGTYAITRQENDWGKSHEWFEMKCLRCQANYAQHTHTYHDPGAPGGTSSLCLWVLRDDKLAVDDVERQIEREKLSMLATAQARYLQKWLENFAGKAKKNVWEELKSIDRSRVPSLGTFYKHTKDDSVEGYLHDWFKAERLLEILAFLGVADSEITDANKRLICLDEECQVAKRKMISAGVHA
jgi:hypothetical protein